MYYLQCLNGIKDAFAYKYTWDKDSLVGWTILPRIIIVKREYYLQYLNGITDAFTYKDTLDKDYSGVDCISQDNYNEKKVLSTKQRLLE